MGLYSLLLRLFCLFETTLGGVNKSENKVFSRYPQLVIRILSDYVAKSFLNSSCNLQLSVQNHSSSSCDIAFNYFSVVSNLYRITV